MSSQEMKVIKDHPKDQVIGDIQKKITICCSIHNNCAMLAIISQIKPKSLKEVEKDEEGCAMQEERKRVWD